MSLRYRNPLSRHYMPSVQIIQTSTKGYNYSTWYLLVMSVLDPRAARRSTNQLPRSRSRSCGNHRNEIDLSPDNSIHAMEHYMDDDIFMDLEAIVSGIQAFATRITSTMAELGMPYFRRHGTVDERQLPPIISTKYRRNCPQAWCAQTNPRSPIGATNYNLYGASGKKYTLRRYA
jgi:hypothetical protein